MKKPTVAKITIIILALLLVASVVFIAVDKWQEARQQARQQELQQAFQQGYNQGLTEAVVALYQQTQECKTTTINIGNITREVVDVACLKSASVS